MLVKSNQNMLDKLTRVPLRWLYIIRKEIGPVNKCVPDQIKFFQMNPVLHKMDHSWSVQCGHEGSGCQFIHPSPVHRKKRELNVNDAWSWVGIDITHHEDKPYLMWINCGPPWDCMVNAVSAGFNFTVWSPYSLKRVSWSNFSLITTLNSTVNYLRAFWMRQGTHLWFHYVYVPWKVLSEHQAIAARW